ncbi:hypothetical protein BDW59DRAFT_165372 [Aspergillus cavernicola]|uniref:Uncharacterized protein n=1 Tax=Aspergillus cavernicola TaxID=176166 RepID=A0ABR4HT98_9EURO
MATAQQTKCTHLIFMQRHNLPTRQAMALTDREWTDLTMHVRTFSFLGFNACKRYGSSFLLFATALNGLGLIISPLQAISLAMDTIKTSTVHQTVDSLLDLTDPDNYRYSYAD